MRDKELRPESWDWSQPFGEDFVRSAVVREDSGSARADRASRISTGHRGAQPWRAAATAPAAHGHPRRRRLRKYDVSTLLCVLGVLGVLFWAGGLDRALNGFDGEGISPVRAAAGPPVPADARKQRMAPLPPPVLGTGGFQLLETGAVGGGPRWDPCRPIHYVTRQAGGPANGDLLIAAGFAELSRATGLAFVSDGATAEAGGLARQPVQEERYGNGWAPVLVTWSEPTETPGLQGIVAGLAGPQRADPDRRGSRYVTGTVTLDAPQLAAAHDAYWPVLLHELGHLAGLDHVEDQSDLMYSGGGRYTGYTPGTLRGLRELGAGPCFS
ncbi:MAG: Peptidase metallopeptidase [Frankiales bacterium]|jgi:hypothetical protein|nr:Peptidase metallopeptidase [Frankiales bacterium]